MPARTACWVCFMTLDDVAVGEGGEIHEWSCTVREISSRDFKQYPERAKREALAEPILILDRGQPSHVLMSIKHYRSLVASINIADLLGMPGIENVTLELPPKSGAAPRPVDL